MAAEVSDLNVIQDEDTLRRMWQQTEDFSRKKEIRLRMYRLREERLKSYYITRETTDSGTISGHKPSILTSHADSLSDHNFLTMKTKEIRDSASPILDLKQQSEFRSVCSSNSSNLNQSQQNEGIIVETDIPSHRTNRIARNEPLVYDTNNLSYEKSSSFTTTTSSAKWTNEKSSNYDGYECDSSKGADYKVDHSSKSDYNPRIENSKGGANSKIIEKTSSMEYAESFDSSKGKSDHRTETFSIVESGSQHDSARSIPDHRMQETCNFERRSRNDDVGATSDGMPEKSLDIARNFSSDNSEAGKRTKVEYSRYVDSSEVVNNRINSSENSSRCVNSDTTRASKNHDTEIYSSICQEKATDQKTLSNHSTRINYIPKETITRGDDHSKNLQTSATSNARNENTDYFSARTTQNRIARDDVNVDKNIMNELHKLDSYLSTEAVVGSPTVTSHHYVSDESPVVAPTETDYTTTYQKSFSKISQDVSATHNAFASSLRASPPPSKRSSSKSSLERSSPEKTPRVSPEKNPSYVGADLSKKLTASFQNRIFNRRETKVSRRRNSTSENDSDDSSATYKKSDINGRCTEISIRKTKGNNRIQDTEYSSEGSVEREMKKYSKSPNSSPERSAFKTVSSIQAEQFQKEVRRQSFPQIPPSPEKSVKRKLQTEERSHSEKIAVRKSPEKNAKIPSFDCKQTERTETTRRIKTEKATKGDDVKIKGNQIPERAKSKTSPTKTECAEQVPSPAQSRASIEKKYVSPVRSFSPTKSKTSPQSFISERNPNSNTPTADSLQTSSTIKNSRIRTETSTPVKTESIPPASEITNPSTSRPRSPEKIATTSIKRDLDRTKPTPPDQTSSPTKQDKNSVQSAQTISYDSSKTVASNESDKTFPSSTIRRSRTSPTKTANAKKTKQKNESESDSSESSSSSSSSASDESDVEKNSVTIEEITSDSELNVTRGTLDEQIKSEDEIQSKDEIDDFALIQEEKVTAFDKIKTSEDFLKQEKLIKEGEIDGSIPPPEVVLGKEAAGLYVDGLNKRDRTGEEKRKVNADDIGPKKAKKVRPKSKLITKPAQEATITSKRYKPLDSDRTLENENLFKKEQLKKQTEKFFKLERSQISNDIVKKSKKTHHEQREPAKKKAAIKAKPLIDDLKITTKSNKENIDRSAKNLIAQERRKMKTDTNVSNKSQNYQNDYWKTTVKRENQYAGPKKFPQGVLTPSGMKDINEKEETRTNEYRVATKPNTAAAAAAAAAVAAIGQRKQEDIKSKSQAYEAIPKKKTLLSKTQFKTSLSKTKLDENTPAKIRKTITIREKAKSPVKKVTDEIANYAKPKKAVARTHLKETKTAIGERNSATPSCESKRKDTPKPQQIRINVEGKTEKRKMPKKKPNNAKTEIVGESSSSRGSSFLDLVDIEESERKEDDKDVMKNDGKLSAETRDSQHLNVIVRMPSSSRETTPKILEEQRFCSVSDDGDYPRYADRVIEPDDVEILKNLTIPRFEKITNLDEEEEEEEEEEKSETVSIADRVSKFLENTKETSTKQQTEVDQVFQNQAVCKTKEIFENIAKNSKPSAVIINRSSVFEPKRLRESIKEEEEAEQPQPQPQPQPPPPQQQQQQHNVVSKKLNDKDYEGYEKEANKVTDDEPLKEHGRHKVVSKKLTVSDYEKYVDEKARDASKQSWTVGRRETEQEQPQPKATKISNVIDFQETSVRVSESNAKSSSNRSSPIDFESASRTTPTTLTKVSSKPKEAGGAVTEKSPSSRKTPSPTRRRYAAKETVVEKTTPFEKLSPKPLKITTVEVKPSKRVFDHTAITSVASCDRYTPIKETFDHQLRRTSSNHSSVTINIREDARKSPSPVKERKYKKPSESVEKKSKDEKSRSPSKERGDRKSFSPVKTRQKSPSPEKSTSKLKKKFQSTTTAETKKEFKKRLSSTGSDYQNRIKFFEIKSQKPIKNPKHCESFEKSQTPYVEIERRSPERNAADRSKRKPSPKKDVQVFSTIESRKPALTNVRQKSPDKLIRAEEASPFDVTRKKTITKNADDAAKEEQSRREQERKVEEIFDLQLLETMLEKAVRYDIRSRIRAQIRLMKRQMESKNISRTPSPEKTTFIETKKVNNSPSRFTNLEAIQTNLDRRDKVKKRLFTEDVKNSGENKAQQRTSSPREHITEYSSLRRSPSKTIAARLKSTVPENGLSCAIKNDFRHSKINANKTKSATESIISGYGVGPTDKNGKPLFGLKALRTSNEGQLNNEEGFIKIKQNKPNQITDVSGKPLFGLKALQNKEQGKYSDLSEKYQNNDKCGGDRSDVQQSHSTVYSSRSTAMRSDSRGNVSILRDEVKGEIHSKAGSEPIGHMTRNQLSYQKPNSENEAGILQTSTTIRNLTSKEMSDYTASSSSSTDACRISNYSTDNTSADDVNWNSKFSSSSLIRKISNEHFEKAQRRFSGTSTGTGTGSGDDSTAKHDSHEKTDLKYKLFSKTESSDSDKTLPSGDKCNYENITQIGRNNSFKEIKSKFQQATVSSSMKQVFRNDDKVSKNENEYSRILQRENTGDSLRSHSDIFEDESKISSSNTFVTTSEMRTFSRSSATSDVRQITGTKSKFENEEKESGLRFEKFTGGGPVSLHELECLSTGDGLNSKSVAPVRKLEKAQNKTNIKELDIDQIFNEEQLRNLLEACTDYENRRLIRARLRAIMANRKGCKDLKSATDNADKTNGECVFSPAQRSQSSPSSIIEDSGTESGEDLRLLNPELLAEVRGALSKLESALPTLDTARRASIIPLVTKLQSCLRVSEPSVSNSVSRRSRDRKSRHTIGVSKEELADARKWLAENFLETDKTVQSSTNSIPMRYDSAKVYKPVKFTPIPPRERDQKAVVECDFEESKSESSTTSFTENRKALEPPQNYDKISYNDDHFANQDEQLKKGNFSSDEGDVSSTEEEKTDSVSPNPMNAMNPIGKYLSEMNNKIPMRFQRKNNKTTKMKRANTIDFPKLINCENITSSGDESAYKSADEKRTTKMDLNKKLIPPPLELKTDKDKKFAAFLEQTKQEDTQTKTVTYNPSAAGGAQWSNRFSHIKTTFEGQKQSSSSEESSKLFKPIKKGAFILPKGSSPQRFIHAYQSRFKPVSKVPSSRNLCQQPSQNETSFNFVYDESHTPKTYYAPAKRLESRKEFSHYASDSERPSFYCNQQRYVAPNDYRKKPVLSYHTKSEYFLNEPSSYLQVPEYNTNMTSQPVSTTIPVGSPSPTYQYPYLSLPTSPSNETCHWKSVDFSEQQAAVSKIMGKPQQAVVINSTNRKNPPVAFKKDFTESKNTYQKLAEKSPLLQNFTQTLAKTSQKVAIQNPIKTYPAPAKKQVKIVALNENEENLPEQFFVLNQKNKFESLNAQSQSQNSQPFPPQINEKAFFKPVTPASKKKNSPPVIVQQSRSPPQSPIIMPSVLQKSESWHQMIMEKMKQAKPPSPIKHIPRAKSTHNLASLPKQFEATLSPESISIKQQTVEQFLGREKRKSQLSPKPANVAKINEDLKNVDETFETLFKEAARNF